MASKQSHLQRSSERTIKSVSNRTHQLYIPYSKREGTIPYTSVGNQVQTAAMLNRDHWKKTTIERVMVNNEIEAHIAIFFQKTISTFCLKIVEILVEL